MASAETLEQLEHERAIIRDLIQQYINGLKSEPDPDERDKYLRWLKFCRRLEGFQKDKISRQHLANRIKQWQKELSSSAIDSAPFDGWEVLDEISKKSWQRNK